MTPPKLDIDAEFDIDVDFDAAGWSFGGKDGADVQKDLAAEIATTLNQSTGIAKSKIEAQLLNYSNKPLITLGAVNVEKSQQALQSDGSARTAPTPRPGCCGAPCASASGSLNSTCPPRGNTHEPCPRGLWPRPGPAPGARRQRCAAAGRDGPEKVRQSIAIILDTRTR